MPPLKKPNAKSKSSRAIVQEKQQKRIALIAQEQSDEEKELSDDQLLKHMASVRRSKAKQAKASEAKRGKSKDVVTKKRRKDGLDTPQSIPPRGNNKKRLGAGTSGDVWDSGRDRSKLFIHESTEAVEQGEEEDGEDGNGEGNGKGNGQGKGKGNSRTKVKGSHLPHIDDMIPDLNNGKIWGATVEDTEHLFGYKDSWARTIYQTYDHTKAVRVCRNQVATHWDLSKEHDEVQAIVKDSGLYPLVENYVKPYIVTANCFVERYHAETDTMHFPFGEMTFIPEDARNILGLEVSRTKTIKLTLLKEKFKNSKERSTKIGWDPAQIRYTAAAYLLHILGTRVFPDTSSNMISANYLQYLDPLEDVFTYSWGTIAMTHLMAEMRRASKATANQFVGNFTLLQVWAYEHFPTLFKGHPFLKIIQVDDGDEPRAKRYQFNNHPKPGNNLRPIEMRLTLDGITTKDVVLEHLNFTNGLLNNVLFAYVSDPQNLSDPGGYDGQTTPYNPIHFLPFLRLLNRIQA
ncbi:hypothetical protein C5167_021349 [Papaver somniferum]|uniref:Aminotransferase-like plant mobile domain-containing protein n=1 Tax=Papaver somniferum TaxID=3469 RepID=A0A4Y7IZL2_PAPSO|nr:hypothetical protein C5167_021349 [Papaver somniferum]